MDHQLLALIAGLAHHHPRGEADAATCRQQLGVHHNEFFNIVDRLADKGYLADAGEGMLKLSTKGTQALEEA